MEFRSPIQFGATGTPVYQWLLTEVALLRLEQLVLAAASSIEAVNTIGYVFSDTDPIDSGNSSGYYHQAEQGRVVNYEIDPHLANVSLLLHGGGSDGSTTFTDSSPQANTVNRVGDTQIDTAQSRFGGSSILFDGTTDALYCDGGSEFSFGTGDFTIEFWLRFNAISPVNPIIVDWRSAASIHPYIGYVSSALVFVANSATRITGPSLSLGTWYHIAVSRVSGTTRMFVDGTKVGSDYVDANNYGVGTNRPIFSGDGAGSGNTFNGWLDEIRITKGVGRYSANFSAPAAAFLDTDGSPGNMTLRTTAVAASTVPGTISVVAQIDQPDDNIALNTDVVFSVSRDGGTTFSDATMLIAKETGTVWIVTGTVDVSGQPSGSSIVLKVTTPGSKKTELMHLYASHN